MWKLSIGVFALAYLFGSVPFGYLVGRARGIDIREHGSHNIGATNILRVVGKGWGLAVFFLDAFKGFAAVRVALFSGCETADETPYPEFYAILAAAACVAGHSFPVWLGFRGGKGVATSAGAILGDHANCRVDHIPGLAVGLRNNALRLPRFGRRSMCASSCRRRLNLVEPYPRRRPGIFLYRHDCDCRLAASVKFVSSPARDRASFHPEMKRQANRDSRGRQLGNCFGYAVGERVAMKLPFGATTKSAPRGFQRNAREHRLLARQ